MKSKNKIGKLFGVLVLGGSVMASASIMANHEENHEEEEICQIKVVHIDHRDFVKTTTCVDEMSDKEILELIKEKRSNSCTQCGCWLG